MKKLPLGSLYLGGEAGFPATMARLFSIPRKWQTSHAPYPTNITTRTP
jgi:hypothetical protein